MLQIKNISKTYKTGDLVQVALNDVSLNLRDNEFVAILGPSGSGKTTLLNIIGGLDRYDRGDLIINGVSTKKYKDRDWDTYRNHTIGFVFQSYNLIPHQTVLKNVELALTISGITGKERKQRALQALEQVGLKGQEHKKPNQMSGGQMQRVAIARALVNNPDILLADEPTGALDTKTSIQVMDLLKQVANDRLVVMVTHNPELAKEYANRIVQLKDGVILSDSNPYNPSQVVVKKKRSKKGKAKMGFLTALSLSFNNLLTKKGRTVLTAFAGSIGIIGIALILSLSQGFQNYIDKIQEDTLTSYPLTIQSETANVFGALLSMRQDSDSNSVADDEVQEQMLISSMMNSVGSNDLKSFKSWLEENQDLYQDDVNNITYSYSVSPRIYTIDETGAYAQLNPNTLMSSIYSDSASSLLSSFSSSSSMGTFSEYDMEEVKKDTELLAGRYPEKYNEVIIVLSQPHNISDLLVYSLGLRDTAELKTLISQVMGGDDVTINNTPRSYTYEDLMNVQLKLIDTTDLYKYNSQYDTYEDMTDDDTWMKDVYDKSEDLIITGVAYTTSDSSSIAGVVYTPDLVQHVIDKASQSTIVKKQLGNKDIDVFSGNRFDEDDDSTGLDFNDMVSIDEDKLKDAFKVNIDTDDFVNLIKEDDIRNIITAATKTAGESVTGVSTSVTFLNTTVLSTYIKAYETQYLSADKTTLTLLSEADLTNYIDNLIAAKPYKTILDTTVTNLKTMATNNDALLQQANLLQTAMNLLDETSGDYNHLSNSVKYSFIAYYKELLTGKHGAVAAIGTTPASIAVEYDASNLLATSASYYGVTSEENETTKISSSDLLNASLADTSAVNEDSIVINRVVSSLTTSLVAQGAMSGSTTEAKNVLSGLSDIFSGDIMTVDTDAFASAFNFDMDEDELSRLMTSMLTSSSASYSNNLIDLGYQDVNDPTSISIYFSSFDSKENFLDLLTSYNDSVEEEKQIEYTDITGLLMSSVEVIINSVTYVLIAFVSISLIVSSIMIAVITLISVMERTKEIGILRAMGASKHNVSSIFNAETFIIGLLSGLIGVGFTYAVIPPINALIHNLTGNYDINAVLMPKYAAILVLISMFLTIFAGIIPSRKASKQDPVIALRSE